ncbi:MAG: chemotaxis protein CheC [Elusimicrobia bacterium]|nr:chemotaxis protein CheC [Elusimicrobiota bacterium]
MTGGFSMDQKAVVAHLLESGAEMSAARLAAFSNANCRLVSSSMDLLTIAGAVNVFQADTTGHLGAHMRAQPPQSPITLDCLVVFPSKSVMALAAAIVGKGGSKLQAVPDRLNAVIGELGNILGQGVVSVLADKLGTSIILSVPQVMLGSKSEILSKAFYHIGGKGHAIILSHMELGSENASTSCSLILAFETDVIRRLLGPSRPA